MWSLVPLPVWKLPRVLLTSDSTFVVNRFIMIFRIIVLAWLIIMFYSLSIVVSLFFSGKVIRTALFQSEGQIPVFHIV